MSLKPRFAAAILDGSKRYELRRVRPKVAAGSRLIIYSSSPVKAVVGTCAVEDVLELPLAELWQQVEGTASVTLAEFRGYFAGLRQGVAIAVNNPCWWKQPIDLSMLRRIWPKFHPPQSYRYLSTEQLERLSQLLPAFENGTYTMIDQVGGPAES